MVIQGWKIYTDSVTFDESDILLDKISSRPDTINSFVAESNFHPPSAPWTVNHIFYVHFLKLLNNSKKKTTYFEMNTIWYMDYSKSPNKIGIYIIMQSTYQRRRLISKFIRWWSMNLQKRYYFKTKNDFLKTYTWWLF